VSFGGFRRRVVLNRGSFGLFNVHSAGDSLYAVAESLAILRRLPSILLKIIRNKVTFTAGDWQPAILGAILRIGLKIGFHKGDN
jgi:hypothetical protein